MVSREDDIGVVGDPELIDFFHELPESNIEVGFRLCGILRCGIFGLSGFLCLLPAALRVPERVVRELEIERLAGFDLPGHEIHPAFSHAKELLRMRLRDVFRPAVVGRAIALVEAVE